MRTLYSLINLFISTKTIPLISLVYILNIYCTNGQSLELFNLNYDEYPIIKANFKAFDKTGSTLFDIEKGQVHIFENNSEQDIVYLKTPEKHPEPLSIILVFDISGSMDGDRLKIAKQAANTFIKQIEGVDFELAITTFNKSSNVNCDFTSNKSKLLNIVDDLSSYGGTNYDSAFLQPKTGIFDLAENAKHKKVIVFMTDGLSRANSDSIIEKAQNINMSVFCTTIQLRMPEVLKEISRATGGDVFEKINSPELAHDIYRQIYNEIIASDMGTVKWKAASTCEKERDVDLKIGELNVKSNYSLAERIEKNFEIKPRSFLIPPGRMGSKITRSFIIKATERPIEIRKFSSDLPQQIMIENANIPVSLKPGENHYVQFSYTKSDSVTSRAKIFIETEDCIEKTNVDIFFGQKGKIKIVNPKGGEVLAVGNELNIQWQGIPADHDVALFYQNGNKSWQRIGNGNNHNHLWTLPQDTGSHFRIKAQSLDYKREESKQLTDKNGFSQIYDLNPEGTLVVYKTGNGLIKVLHTETGQALINMRYNGNRFVFLGKENDRLISLYKSSFGIQNIINNTPEMYMQSGSWGFLFSSRVGNNGDEYLLPSGIDRYNYPGDKKKITDYATSKTFLTKTNKGKPAYTAVTDDGEMAFMITGEHMLLYVTGRNESPKKVTQLDQGYKKVIVSPNGEYCHIQYPLYSQIVRTQNGKNAFRTNKEIFLRFSPDGNKIMSMDTSTNNLVIRNLDDEKKILEINSPKLFNFSRSGRYVHYLKNNMVYVNDLEDGQIAMQKNLQGTSMISISRDDNEIMVLRMATVEIYDIGTGELNSKITDQSFGGVLSSYLDINGNVIIQTLGKLSFWEPVTTYEPGLSNEFSIVAPIPDVFEEYDFGQVETNAFKEVIIENLVTNNTNFPIKIESIEYEDDSTEFQMISGMQNEILEPGNSISIETGFYPQKTGDFSNNLIVNTPDSSFICLVKGEAISKTIELPNKRADFGEVKIGKQKNIQIVAIKNIGQKNLTIDEIVNIGPDKSQFGFTKIESETMLGPQEELKLELFFMARSRGMSSGNIKIEIKDYPQPIIVNMLAKGIGSRKVKIYGQTFNSKDSTFISSYVHCTELKSNGEKTGYHTNGKGEFSILMSHGGNFLLHAEKAGFISGSENIDLSGEISVDSIHRDIFLTPVESGSIFRLNGIFFEFAKADLKQSSKNDLERLIGLLQSYPNLNLEIHGHTDFVGSNESNMELSEKRANAVMNFLIENKIAKERLSIRYFGESKPIATNETEEGRQMNRRVEFVIVQ